MKESVGYTVTLNIIITFIIILFAFLSATLIYYKSNKVSNVITTSIEKYEGYNNFSVSEIQSQMNSLGYSSNSMEELCGRRTIINDENVRCTLTDMDAGRGINGYCVYECIEGDYYYYRIRIRAQFNVPIINELIPIPIYSNTNRLYDFK